MRYLFSLFFLFLVISGAGQSKKGNIENRFAFGLSFSPDYTYRIYDSGPDFPGDIWDEVEDPRFGFTTGLVAKYFLTKKLALESGLQFADKGYKIETSGTMFSTPADINYDPNSNTGEEYWIHSKYHYYYLGIPLKADWYIINRDVRVFLSAGFSTDFFLNSKEKSKYLLEGEEGSEEHSEDDLDFHKLNIVGLTGLGAEYELNRNLHFQLEPIVRISFTSATTYTTAMRYWYSLGVNFSVFFQK